MKERELRTCESQSPKMYEHVGMADNHHRRRSDERQITPSFDHNNKNEERRSQSMIETKNLAKLLHKDSKFKTTSIKEIKRSFISIGGPITHRSQKRSQ